MSEAACSLKLLCVAGNCAETLDLNAVTRAFCFVRKDVRFGGRLCVALEGATVWIYASGKIVALGGKVGEVKAAYGVARLRLEEGGYATHVGDATPWNVVRQIKTDPRERLGLRKICGKIPGSRFERAQRAVLCRCDHGVDEVAGHSLVQIYSSGKLLIRGRHEGPLPQPIRDLIPTIKNTRQAVAGRTVDGLFSHAG